MASVMDVHTSRFITRNLETLKDSVILFLGDHGNRYGSQMFTRIGRLESSWPYLAINVPKSVQDKYPNLVPNMKQNSKRLVSWLDVHAALKDLANCDLEPKSSPKLSKDSETDLFPVFANQTKIFTKKSNYSLFTESIPIDRSCEDALIPSPFCFCLPRQKLSAVSSEAHRAGEEFVKQLNKKLEIYHNLCAKMSLYKVIDISKLHKSSNSITYDIVIQVMPFKGVIRGELKRLRSNEWSLDNLFERFDKYANQGDCIPNKILQKICYCNKQKN